VEPDLALLASGLSADALEEGLAPAFEDGLLVTKEGGGALRFRHARVQQAACARLEPGRKRLLHLDLARRLAPQPGLETLAAEQYLPALEALDDPAEKRRAIGLLRGAAAGAGMVNLEEAERLLGAACQLVKSLEDAADLPLLLSLETERHQVLYGLGRFEAADAVYRTIERLAKEPLDRAQAASIQVCSLTNRALPAQAVALGVGLLRELGVAVPGPEQLEAETARGLERFNCWIESPAFLEDRQRPESNDSGAMAAARLINRIIPPAFFCNQAMMSWWLVLESWRLWVAHGPCAALVGPLAHLASSPSSSGRTTATATRRSGKCWR
jgi:predicted ATPase